jgi:CRISPR-associated protein Csb2
LLRALVAVWKRKLPHLTDEQVGGVLSVLASTPPLFRLPPATLGHTRHYMPTHDKPTKVFDAFISLDPKADVVFHWPDAALSEDGERTLGLLLSQLGYFGRAESWCAARLHSDPGDHPNCTRESREGEPVRVLTADPATWNGWAFGGKIPHPNPKWNLLAETADLHQERWSDPPGSKWVTYFRPADCFAPRPSPRPVAPGDAKSDFTVARFVLDVAEGRRPLPLVTQTLPFAEEIRRELGRMYVQVIRERNGGVEIAWDDPRTLSPILHGKDATGEMARSHSHAFYLPTDEDRDGRIDHVTIYASGLFSRDDVAALDRLRSLSFGKEGEADAGGKRKPTHHLLLVGLVRDTSSRIRVFGRSKVWVSSTPYIAFRHLKQRGKKRDPRDFIPPEAMPDFMRQVLGEDWDQRGDLGPKPRIEFVADPLRALRWKYRILQFRRARNRTGDDGFSRPFGAFRLTFDEEVDGPFSLGYACHFGMGAFRPASE